MRMTSKPWSAWIGLKCILPTSAVWYPAAFRACATVHVPARSDRCTGPSGSRWGCTPVRNALRAGLHSAAALYACSKTAPSAASASSAGVSNPRPA